MRENIAWDREDCAFISVSFVRRMDVPLRSRLEMGSKNPGNVKGKRANGVGGEWAFAMKDRHVRSEPEEPDVGNRGSCISMQHAAGNAERIEGGGKGCLLHNLGRIFHADFPKTIPNDVTVFVLPNLNVTAAADRVFVGEQVKKVFVINLDEGALESEVPGTDSFLAKLPCTREDCCYSSWDDPHTVLWVSGVGIEVDTGHCMRLAGTGLPVGEDGTVEALQEPRNERVCGGCKDSMLGGRGTVDLVKSELLLL